LAAVIYAVAMVVVLIRLEIPPIGSVGLMLVGFAGVVQISAKWLWGLLFRQGVVATGGELKRMTGFRAALVGAGVARLVPAGGAITPVAMSWIVRGEVAGTMGAAVRSTVLNYSGLLIGTGFSLLWIRGRGLYEAMRAGTVSLAFLAIALGTVLMFGTRWLGSLGQVLPRFLQRMVGNTLANHGPDRIALGLLVGRLVAEAAAMALVFEAFGFHLSPTQAFAAFGLSQLAGGLPGTPGGAGFAELGLVAALAWFGFPAGAVLAPTLVFRIVSYWLPAAAGLVVGGAAFLKVTPQVEQAALV
jgi:uncharacterized membrane protein YbhN (UPF0104 family)